MDAGVLVLAGMVLPFASYGVAGLWADWKKRHPADPRAVLADRYARGQIDEQEYGRRLAVLTYGPEFPAPPPGVTLPTGLPGGRTRRSRT